MLCGLQHLRVNCGFGVVLKKLRNDGRHPSDINAHSAFTCVFRAYLRTTLSTSK